MQSDPDKHESLTADPPESMEVIRLGKDEMNLAEFPITMLTDRVPKGKKTIQFQDTVFDEKLGKRITRKLTIEATDSQGLPTAVDDDVILGLIQLTKMVNDFTSREVEFSRLDAIRVLGWPDSGDSYRRLATSLKRWLSVTLLYENAWRDNRKGVWTTKGFHILDNIELNDTRTVNVQGELFPSKITWNKVVFESFAAGYLKSIDYGMYIKLKHTIARRMYRFLSKRMYFGPDMSFDLRDLAFAHIGLSNSYSGNAGKIKEKLQPAIEELETAGFLEPMAKEERYQKDGKNWKIRLVAKTKISAPSSGSNPTGDESTLVTKLINRGVTPKTAAKLVEDHPSAFIEGKIEQFDWEMTRPKPPKKPAGYLVKSIIDGYNADPDFVSKAERDRQAEAKRKADQAAREERRQKHEAEARDNAKREAVDAYIKQLTSAERAEHEAEALAQATEEARGNYEAPAFARFRETYMLFMLREYVGKKLTEQKALADA